MNGKICAQITQLQCLCGDSDLRLRVAAGWKKPLDVARVSGGFAGRYGCVWRENYHRLHLLQTIGCCARSAVYDPKGEKSFKNAFDFTKKRFVSRGVLVFR